ncbi:Nucleolar protein 16 [Savitreella phatthalungensis]
MANPRQRRKARSSAGKLTRRTADKLKRVNIAGNPVMAAHWDKHKTLRQNYKALGLVADPNHHVAGGVEKLYPDEKVDSEDELAAGGGDDEEEEDEQGLKANEAIIRRDADGNVVEVVYSKLAKQKVRHQGDEGEDEDEDEDARSDDSFMREETPEGDAGATKSEVVRALEERAARGEATRPRQASEGERAWLEKLTSKYGDDYKRAARDRKLNPMQQTSSDIARRVARVRRG